MSTIETDSWEHFLKILETKKAEIRDTKYEHIIPNGDFYFRGHKDANWELDTTLERFSDREWSVKNYLISCLKSSRIIESYKDSGFNLPSLHELTKELNEQPDELGSFLTKLPIYDYIVFLRHHSYPSPLLDWTRSVYIAAFFAFADSKPEEGKFVSIYLYKESKAGVKSGWVNAPQISILGKYVKTHPRHFLQQADYSIAVKYNEDTKEHDIVSHKEIFKNNRKSRRQDILHKFNIPSTEKNKVMDKLEKMNINEYSLFQTQESLIKTVARQEI